jgi:hypothetical protein
MKAAPSGGENAMQKFMIPAAALSLACLVSSAQAGATAEREGTVQITKDCTSYTGKAGSSCTITSSNIAELPTGTVVYYLQRANIVPGLLDSNVILDAGNGNRATGRCTFDLNSFTGLCQFTDGTGQLAGFEARVDVAATTLPSYSWSGPYHFKDTRGHRGA